MKGTHWTKPSSRIACSSALQSVEIPGLCFNAPTERSGTEFPCPLVGFAPTIEEGVWLASWWWIPDGFAIKETKQSKEDSVYLYSKIQNSNTEIGNGSLQYWSSRHKMRETKIEKMNLRGFTGISKDGFWFETWNREKKMLISIEIYERIDSETCSVCVWE